MDKSLLEYYSRDGEPDSPDPLATSGGYDALVARLRRQNAINAENAARGLQPMPSGRELIDMTSPIPRRQPTRNQEKISQYLRGPRSASPYTADKVMNAWNSAVTNATEHAEDAAASIGAPGIGALPPELYRDVRFAAPDRKTPAYEPGQPYDEEETGNVLFRRNSR